MKKRILSLVLTVALLFSVVSLTAVRASAASSMKASESLISLLKEMEGFLSKPVWDYSQYSVGYGSGISKDSEAFARYMESGIPEEEADALLRKYVEDSRHIWEGHVELDNLPVHTVGATIGTHVGPGAIALAFFKR